MRLLERKGWTIARWKTLDDDEQVTWLAWEQRRQHRIDALLAQLSEKRKGDSGREYSNLSAEAYVALLLARL